MVERTSAVIFLFNEVAVSSIGVHLMEVLILTIRMYSFFEILKVMDVHLFLHLNVFRNVVGFLALTFEHGDAIGFLNLVVNMLEDI